MTYSLNMLYKVLGITKQAVIKYAKGQVLFEMRMHELMVQVDEIRESHPGCGIEKMYYTIKPDFLGRDAFIDYFMSLGYRVKYNKNYRRTTISSKIYYPNLIKGMEITRPNQLWQTDITYFEVNNIFYYGIFIIDVYTKEIVGYNVSNHMRATANMIALNKAIEKHGKVEVHHSDRGSQYIAKKYISILLNQGTQISMGLSAQDNAYAERINRTIKEEYLSHWKITNFNELRKAIEKAVENYNTKRNHNAFLPDRTTPVSFKEKVLSLPKQNRPKVRIYTEGNDKIKGGSTPFNFKQNLPLVQNCQKV